MEIEYPMCPILSIDPEAGYVECKEHKCAWYLIGPNSCAVAQVAFMIAELESTIQHR